MRKGIKIKAFVVNFCLLLFATVLNGQTFSVEKLITIEGNNRNVALASSSAQEILDDAYICWENQLDSIYTIYFKQLGANKNHIYSVYSGKNQNIKPTIAFDPVEENVRIAWQSKIDTLWQLLTCDFKNGGFSNVRIVGDTTLNNSSPSIGSKGLAWIQEGKLIYTNKDSETFIVDSMSCSNPKLFPYEYSDDPMIVYEKGDENNKQIYFARHIGQHREYLPYWEVEKISNDTHNINPSFGTLGGISYQTLEDSVWKVVHADFFGHRFVKTNNKRASFEHPMLFRYPIPTSGATPTYTDFFVAFDTDSLDNKEIFIKRRDIHSSADSILNISESEGDDSKPIIGIIGPRDSSKVAIVWEHQSEEKTDIWWVTIDYNPIPGNVENEIYPVQNFLLYQNYPNPFNHSTQIWIQTANSENVELDLYDLNARWVKKIYKGYLPSGNHMMNLYAGTLASGIYFINYVSNSQIRVLKVILVK
ncbi:T9SS type A sorting domain-containing protein [candidate division KSB1 bacterium]|nr:T9SS type A sorting domain-containing protein [candidate division KSB1 bacterium]